jgi:hypothetical protein
MAPPKSYGLSCFEPWFASIIHNIRGKIYQARGKPVLTHEEKQ